MRASMTSRRQSGAWHACVPAEVAAARHYTRLDLADWLVSPDHPLTARGVNRFWQQFFGTGLVRPPVTSAPRENRPAIRNFDWLAVTFRETDGMSNS